MCGVFLRWCVWRGYVGGWLSECFFSFFFFLGEGRAELMCDTSKRERVS
jgi:hypothetical protein